MQDEVNSPYHYANSCSLECIDVILLCFGKKETIDWCKITAFKYLWRYKNKGNVLQDLDKALWYINYAKKLESENDCDNQLLVFESMINKLRSEIS